MNETIFWKTIEALNWQSDYDTSRINTDLKEFFEKDEREGLYKEFCKAHHDLNRAYIQWANKYGEWVEPNPKTFAVYDLKDAISNIIGCGRQEYYSHLNHPRLILDKLEDFSSFEGFAHVWK